MLSRPAIKRREMVKQFIGNNAPQEGTKQKKFVNLTALYVQVVLPHLIANAPRVMLSTMLKQHRHVVTAMELWANKEIERTKLASTLERAIVDALFLMGTCKVSLVSPAESAKLAWNVQAGRPGCFAIPFDNMVWDMDATNPLEVEYVGHSMRVPIDAIKQAKFYEEGRKDLEPDDYRAYSEWGEELTAALGRGDYKTDPASYKDHVTVWELYLPQDRMVVTLAGDANGGMREIRGKALRYQNWIGPYCGPYPCLQFQPVPDNLLGKGPISDLFDLDVAANGMYRKVVRMTERTKEITGVAGGADADGNRVLEADDGAMIRLDNPERITQFVTGGKATQSVFVMATALKDLFSFMGGNLELLGGRSPQSKTATQDEMLNANAAAGINQLQKRTIEFVSEVIKSLCWYWHHDPIHVMRTEQAIPGVPEMQLNRTVTPQQRMRIPFEELDIKVDPYSMQHQTPQQRLAFLNNMVAQLIPIMPMLQAQGILFDANKWLSLNAKYGDAPDINELFTIGDPPLAMEGGSGPSHDTVLPASTERTYNRRNIAADEGAESQQMLAAGMGVDTGGSSKPSRNGTF